MWICKARIQGIAPYGPGKPIESDKGDRENHEDFDKRVWREHMNLNAEGLAVIPPMAFKNALIDAAGLLYESVKEKGATKYKKYFMCGTMVVDEVVIEPHVRAEDAEMERLFLPSDGRRGGGKRVWRRFPVIPTGWECEVVIYVTSPDLYTKNCAKVEEYLRAAGQFIGVGRFRAQNGGFYGRFIVLSFDAQKLAEGAVA